MYSKQTRHLCYALTLLPALIGLFLKVSFGVLLTPVLLTLVLKLCLYLSEKMEGDPNKNKKINNVVIWILPALSNVTFWISYALFYERMDLSIGKIMGWMFGILYLVLGNYLPKCRENSIVGIRVKWTYSTEENWNATHRLAGFLYVACGFLMLAMSFLPEKIAFVSLLVLLAVSNAVPLLYSYRFYRKQKAQGVPMKERPKLEKKVKKAVLSIAAVAVVLVGVLLFTGSVKTEFREDDLHVLVTYYGSQDIPYSDIASVELRTENVDGTRVWGLGSFRLLAGRFENEEFGPYTCLTYYDPQSAIVLKTTKGETIVLSGKNGEESQAIYGELLAHLSQSK